MSDREKQLKISYRSMFDAVQKLDALLRQSDIGRMFCREAQKQRKRIRIHGERQLFLLSQRREKIEEIVWRKVFYDVIETCKRCKEFTKQNPFHSNLKSHLSVAGAFYRHLMLRMQKEFGLDFRGILPWVSIRQQSLRSVDEDIRDWALALCHRSLIYLGDLARYYFKFYGGSAHLPATYYRQAICLDPAKGLPHNQLALLSGSLNERCDAAFHYLMCLVSHQPYPGAQHNLNTIWEQNTRTMEEMEKTYKGGARERDIRDVVFSRFIIRFLDLQRLLHPPCQSAHQSHLTIVSDKVLHDFIECLGFKLHEDVEMKGKACHPFFPGLLMLRVAAMAMLSSYKLRLEGSTLTPTATAFAISLFSQLLQHCVQSIDQWKKRYRDGQYQSSQAMLLPFDQKPAVMSADTESPKRRTKSSRRRLPSSRRRRRRRGGGDSDEEGDEGNEGGIQGNSSDDDSDLSEGQADFDSDCLSTDYSDSEVDEKPSQAESLPSKRPLAIRFPGVTLPEKESKGMETMVDELSPSLSSDEEDDEVAEEGLESFSVDLIRWLCEHEFLPIVKVVCDWLRIHPAVAASCTQNLSAFWSRLADLLNALPNEESLYSVGCPKVVRLVDGWKQSEPLPEDVELLGFPPLGRSLDELDFNWNGKEILTEGEQGLLRIKCILNFGYFMAKAKTVSDFARDEVSGHFIGPSHRAQKEATVMAERAKQVEESDKERRSRLMKALAEQKLKSDVATMEQSLASAKLTSSPVLVVDAQCLCAHLKIIRHLLASKKFILIIPIHVIDALDDLKKGRENRMAREAIKFLEEHLQARNKWLKAQKKEESADSKADLTPSQYRQKDMAAWRFTRVVDCARYFTNEMGPGLVTLLYSTTHTAVVVVRGDRRGGQEPDTGTRPTNTALAIAKKHGIIAEEITTFYANWKR